MKRYGFTLAELLIVLALLGVISAFVLSKVLDTQGSQRNIAISKEVVGMVSAVFYRQVRELGRAPTAAEFRQYMRDNLNYVTANTLGVNNGVEKYTNPYFRFHNGAIVMAILDDNFGGGTGWAAPYDDFVYVNVDVNGKSPPNGYCVGSPGGWDEATDDPAIVIHFRTAKCPGEPGDYLEMFLLRNGRVTSGATAGWNQDSLMDHW